jgi:hypothetical protein
MNDNIPVVELPEFATLSDRLARSVSLARENVSYRVGYEVELASIIPIEREGHTNLRVLWRRKSPELTLVGGSNV